MPTISIYVTSKHYYWLSKHKNMSKPVQKLIDRHIEKTGGELCE